MLILDSVAEEEKEEARKLEEETNGAVRIHPGGEDGGQKSLRKRGVRARSEWVVSNIDGADGEPVAGAKRWLLKELRSRRQGVGQGLFTEN